MGVGLAHQLAGRLRKSVSDTHFSIETISPGIQYLDLERLAVVQASEMTVPKLAVGPLAQAATDADIDTRTSSGRTMHTATRELRHARTPVVRSQIRGLKAAAQHSATLALNAPENERIGHVLAANMNAGFALELGLKLFAMTFAQTVPRGHHLKTLYDALPAQIRGDIASTYENALQAANVNVISFAFQFSAQPPPKPSGSLTGTAGWATAATFFESANETFVQARYFYEEVGEGAWAAIDHPAAYLVAMIDTLDDVYQAYLDHGGYGPRHFPDP